ncbi:MAG: hypothetical protein EZS28_043369, partial [Streblomastix strix]
MEDRIALTYQ